MATACVWRLRITAVGCQYTIAMRRIESEHNRVFKELRIVVS